VEKMQTKVVAASVGIKYRHIGTSKALVGRLEGHESQTTVSCHRAKPQRGRYKCNVDASFLTSENKLGIVMCIRDDEGCYVLAITMWFLSRMLS